MKAFDFNIFLIGFMGAGKSTIARELGQLLHMETAEMDALIVQKQGMEISEIFSKYGEGYFRDVESSVLIDLQQKTQTVISCGGGVVVRSENTGYMKKSGRIVLLTATPETIYARVKDSDERPILNNNMSVEFISSLMEKRDALYRGAAEITVATDGKSTAQICAEIIERLSADPAANH